MALCREDFLAFVLNRVQQTIDRYKLFAPREKVLVAVSGGKDSLALFDILQRLGYAVEGLYIDMGIDGFSQRGHEAAEAFVAKREAPLHLHPLREEMGARDRLPVAKTSVLAVRDDEEIYHEQVCPGERLYGPRHRPQPG